MSDYQKAFIDGDMILYRAAFSSEDEVNWDSDLWSLTSDLSMAKVDVEYQLYDIQKRLKVEDFVVCFSDRSTFRHQLFPEYKANRKGKRKPLAMGELKQWMWLTFNCLLTRNLEADDIIGIQCTANPNYIAVSGDKDFATLPCAWHNHLKNKTVVTSTEEADFALLCQTLSGDATDGFEGVKGIGMKRAERFLKERGATWQTVVDIYKEHDLLEFDALLTGRLARILRYTDYEDGQVKLWNPRPLNTQQLNLDL